ncbi:MAG: adenine-specific methyltransferase EcoRI family protein [Eubacterium sp.]|nr:adenine-specific methyltransferase EcoRI family protein [Eubacterium sp.]
MKIYSKKVAALNSNFAAAKKNKNDEFYTQLSDIEKEIFNYEYLLRGKKILCNCNDDFSSGFWRYFSHNFIRLRLKSLTAVKYTSDKPSYMLEMYFENDEVKTVKTNLSGNGDFRSDECIRLLEKSDIVITNPPFSLFREYIALLLKFNKRFLIVGNSNAVTYKDVFMNFKDNKLWFGVNSVRNFIQQDGKICSFGNILWYTNLNYEKQYEKLKPYKKYSESAYSVYDNFPAIEVGRAADIPYDYNGLMGVPISFLTKYNPEQFEIIGMTNCNSKYALSPVKWYENAVQHKLDGTIGNGNKVNTAAAILLKERPSGTYYTASNADGYLVCVYVRVLIRLKRI